MPRWTPDDLRAFEERQRQRDRDYSRTPAVVEPNPSDEPVGPSPLQEANDERISVRVFCVRKRLLDEDNTCEKFLVDALRYSGFIPDDCPEKVHIEVSQRKCWDGEPEHVRIEIL